jgi:hypothetical protein
MSDDRTPAKVWAELLPGQKGKYENVLELFPVEQFLDKLKLTSKSKRWPYTQRSSQLAGRFRLRLNGRWHNKAGYDYTFFTEEQAVMVFLNA